MHAVIKGSKGRIVYVGPMSFPEGGAGARRILGNSLSLIEAGYEVFVGSGQMPRKTDQTEIYEGIKVYSTGERIAEDKPVLIKHLIYSRMGKKTVGWLKTLNPEPIAIILYGGDIPYLSNLMPWCKSRQIPLIFEACEWYDPTNMPGGRYSPYRINFVITMRYLVPKVKNVITISSFLDTHFKTVGCETVCVPPTLDTRKLNCDRNLKSDNILQLGYTGTPGNKDLFNNYLEALLQTDPEGKRFRFNIAGLTDEEILNYPAMKERNIIEVPVMINSIGKVSQADAIELIRKSDFSILLRYPRRYAQAGFPTKVVESMAVGTPVICNLTSDLGKYIQDGVNGLVCKDHTVASLINALKRAQKLSGKEVLAMSINSRRVAEASFDYRAQVSALGDFIERLRKL
jgi:glycosyltransferase involved in cell wall biosynthesis